MQLLKRYENIDDSRYGGSLTVNQPMAFVTPRDRYDLQAASGDAGFTKRQISRTRKTSF